MTTKIWPKQPFEPVTGTTQDYKRFDRTTVNFVNYAYPNLSNCHLQLPTYVEIIPDTVSYLFCDHHVTL